mmetsp:Transcript_25043/g.80926  ORF Transcript_25043/g.80926 Transcript_25043/m.80926 type:complete len:312 (+) Transcript_25043:880-1815(+)
MRLSGELGNLVGNRFGVEPELEAARRAAFGCAASHLRAAEEMEPGHKRSYIAWAFASDMLHDIEGCRHIADLAITHCRAFWSHRLQRPNHFVTGVTSRPWWDPKLFPWVRQLEENWAHIRAELDALDGGAVLDGDGCSSAWPEVRGHDKDLAGSTGTWREFPLLGLGEEDEDRARRVCPVTRRLLSSVEAVRAHRELRPKEETALFSRLTPGTRLRPHCGPSNTHLTCHLGLRIPPGGGCRIRVGDESREWKDGRCLVFDDSWEHEVWHDGNDVRVVLLIRFWHPDIRLEHRESILRDEARDRMCKSWTLL